MAGANSTVLTEARLMFLKPAYAYGRSWFTSHAELIVPISYHSSERLPGRWDRVEHPELMQDEWLMDYTDWYLHQLLSRQLPHGTAGSDWQALRRFVDRLSFHSYLRYGEEIFQ